MFKKKFKLDFLSNLKFEELCQLLDKHRISSEVWYSGGVQATIGSKTNYNGKLFVVVWGGHDGRSYLAVRIPSSRVK